jgi:hypothetical protein
MEKAVRRRELWLKWISRGLLVFVAFFVVTHSTKAAITGKIAGVIVDARTGEPLPGANVLVEGTERGAAADVDGYYYIIRLEPGAYNIQARMIGYKSVTKTGVKVISGHTTPLDFQLEPTVVPGEGVVVEAEREVVKMDLAGSSFSAEKADIEAVPLISDAVQYLNYQAGIDGWSVRGGGISQTKLMADGLLLVDQRVNEPIMMPNLSEIKEVNLLKGGFEAEFANVRSGVINVVTREGSPEKYEGSFEFRFTPGYQKHKGSSIFDPDNYHNSVFLWNKLDTGFLNIVMDTLGNIISQDTIIKYDSVCWKGVTQVWGNRRSPFYDTVKANSYPSFLGWEREARNHDEVTPEDCRDMFVWLHCIKTEGDTSLPWWNEDHYINAVYDTLTGNLISQDTLFRLMTDFAYAPIYDTTGGDSTITGYTAFPWEPGEGEEWPAKYGDKPDWTVDAGFGGPVPVIGSYLGDMTFYASYRDHNDAFAIPDSRDYYRERMTSLKLTSRFGNFKLNLRGAYSVINSLSPWARGDQEGHAEYFYGYNGQVYLRSGRDIIDPTAEWDEIDHGSDKLSIGNLYRANALSPFDVTSRVYGLTLQHALSENTFYDVRLTYIRRNFDSKFYYDVPRRIGGDTVVRWFGDTVLGGGDFAVDNIPYGYAPFDEEEPVITDAGGANYGYTSQLGTWNTSWSETYNVSFDMTSQLDKINQVKFGFSAQYDNLYEYWIANDGWGWPDRGEETTYQNQQYLYNNYNASPIMAGGYIQDKIEFEGMFANLGFRLDYADPNTTWPNPGTYSVLYSSYLKQYLLTESPMEDVGAHFKISPRLGISFPILERSKLFFNYGHFYSTPPNEFRYKINWGDNRSPVIFMGNPALDMERTISYEVGLESSIASTYLARISGYYTDRDKEYADVSYASYFGDVGYITVENNGYSDVRGFEFEFRKSQGRFFTGWVNYDYRVTTSGQTGREIYYEDLQKFQFTGVVLPEQDRPVPQPVFRAQVTLKAPLDWGIFLGGYNLSFLYSWRAGRYDTYMGSFTEEWRDEFQNNIQWPADRWVDMSFSKNLVIGGAPISLLFDIHNVFDWQTLSTQGFSDGIDQRAYLRTLHLELFNEEPWKSGGYYVGPAEGEEPDHIGDLQSEEKPYINNPDKEFLWYLDPRYVQFGIRISF